MENKKDYNSTFKLNKRSSSTELTELYHYYGKWFIFLDRDLSS